MENWDQYEKKTSKELHDGLRREETNLKVNQVFEVFKKIVVDMAVGMIEYKSCINK